MIEFRDESMVMRLVLLISGILIQPPPTSASTNTTTSNQSFHEFSAGIIMVEKSNLPFHIEMVGPAIDMAMEVAEETYGIRFKTHYKLYPSRCNAEVSVGAVADLFYQDEVEVLIGPACSSDINVCGKLATHFNLPQVTGVGDLVLAKADFPTLTRLSYSLQKQSVFIAALLRQYHWRNVVIIYDIVDLLMVVQGSALVNALRDDPTFPLPYYIEFDTTKGPDFQSFLIEAKQHGRVIVFLSSGGDLRRFMLAAHAMGMPQSGEYAFLTIELFRSVAWGDFSWKRGDSQDEAAKEAFQSLLLITLTEPGGPKWRAFTEEVTVRAERDYNYTFTEPVNYFVGAFYDGVIYLTMALNQTLQDGHDPKDGLYVAQRLWNSTFEGVTGDVFIDSIGDKIADYTLLDMTDLNDGIFQVVGKYYGSTSELVMDRNIPIHWPGPFGLPPPNEPHCGFKNDAPECTPKDNTAMAVGITGAAILVLCSLIGFVIYFYKRKQFENAVLSNTWRVNWDDVRISRGAGMGSTMRMSMAVLSHASVAHSEDTVNNTGQVFTAVGNYNGQIVAIRDIPGARIELNRIIRLELKQIREVHHDNLTRFVGACVDGKRTVVLTEYCPKGSLQDILANEAIQLDWLFKYSLINDIVRGMNYIHSSPLHVHGKLKSSNCVVDSRFVLKLTDYGLPSFYDTKLHIGKLFWTAPEILQKQSGPSQKADSFAFGIILHEIITREEPYGSYEAPPSDVIKRVVSHENPPFRPKTNRELCVVELFNLMEVCWADLPAQRPTFPQIRTALRAITKEDNQDESGIMDSLIRRLEQYTENLEAVVEDRTRAFLDEKKKSEDLLYRVLPRSIADQLKKGKAVHPETYPCVTIYFSDIVGFTSLSASSTPIQVVDLLNDLYSTFDATIASYDVYKVETIGDAYMVVSGLPIKNGNTHAREIARMSLCLLDSLKVFKIRHRPEETLRLRIGLHTGACVAGVVGLTMPRYCLFGDTVNTASRMESTGEALKIHVSPFTKEALDKFGTFELELRGETSMKGKGTLLTYWLLGETKNKQSIMSDPLPTNAICL